jgi:uncharacterized membrane protein (DUF106 family)
VERSTVLLKQNFTLLTVIIIIIIIILSQYHEFVDRQTILISAGDTLLPYLTLPILHTRRLCVLSVYLLLLPKFQGN